jgi:hypothetical protein
LQAGISQASEGRYPAQKTPNFSRVPPPIIRHCSPGHKTRRGWPRRPECRDLTLASTISPKTGKQLYNLVQGKSLKAGKGKREA